MLNWSKLFLSGSIVDLHCGMWRAKMQIKARDLGIEDTQEVQRALSLGRHRLAPPESFNDINEIRGAATRAVDEATLNFGLIRGARYIPNDNLLSLKTKLRDYQKSYYGAVDAFMKQYDEMKRRHMPVIERALKDAAKTKEAAELAFERINDEYPGEEDVRGKFSFRWNVYAIQSARTGDAAEVAGEESGNVKSIVRDMITQLRDEMKVKLAKIMKTISKGGKINSKQVDSALKMIDRVESLNVLGDKDLRIQARAMRGYLESVADGEADKGFVSGMDGIQKSLDASVEEAVRNAENRLAGLGQRKLELD